MGFGIAFTVFLLKADGYNIFTSRAPYIFAICALTICLFVATCTFFALDRNAGAEASGHRDKNYQV